MTERRILGLPVPWARRALIASLAVNFLVFGVFVGGLMKPKPTYGPNWGGFVSKEIAGLAAAGDRAEISGIMEARRETIRAMRGERTRTWVIVAQRLSATPFDAAALQSVIAEQVGKRNAVRAKSYAAMAKAMTLLSSEDRLTLARRINAHIEHRAAIGRK